MSSCRTPLHDTVPPSAKDKKAEQASSALGRMIKSEGMLHSFCQTLTGNFDQFVPPPPTKHEHDV